jgi:hypothetical protein
MPVRPRAPRRERSGAYTGFRFVYCQDCRVFAQFLEGPDALDIAVGTDIRHTRFKLTPLPSSIFLRAPTINP